jgi:hypothetical protein
MFAMPTSHTRSVLRSDSAAEARRVSTAQNEQVLKNLHNGLGKWLNGGERSPNLRSLIDGTQDLWKTPISAGKTVCLKFFGS